MARLSRMWVPVVLAVTMAFFIPLGRTSAATGSLEGRWELVEQHYGKGKANLADLEAPVMLEFCRDLEGGHTRFWTGDGKTEVLSWPVYVTDEGSLPVEILERSADPASRRAFARYRVKPSPTDDLVLLIIEEYTVAEDDDTLRGSVTVTFTVGEDTRGSFVLHRRFERMGL